MKKEAYEATFRKRKRQREERIGECQ